MSLSGKQKKYLKKHLRKDSLERIASSLNVSVQEIEVYLQKKWGKEKYQKFLAKQKETKVKHAHNRPAHAVFIPSVKTGFNLKEWFVKNRLILAILTLLVIVAYINSLGNEFVSDDINGILKNPHLDQAKYIFANRFSFFYAFIRYFITKLFGRTPIFYRSANILSHLGVTLTVYLLLNLLGLSKRVAFFAASIFAVHPILTESVTWISGGYYSYSTLLALLSFSTYILSTSYQKKRLYLPAVILYFLALETSEKVIAFPIILLLYEIARARFKQNWKKLIPFFILSFIWGAYLTGALTIRSTALKENFYQTQSKVENRYQQIISFIRLLSVSITSYLSLIFWPNKLTLYHSEMSFTPIGYLIRFFILLAIIITTLWSYQKDRRIFFWLSWFFIALSPTLTPFGVSWIVAERYVYLASIGIFVIIAMGIEKIGKKFKNQDIPWVILALILAALVTRTIIRNKDWKNQDTLWLAAAKTSPSSPQNHNNLGDLYGRHGNLDKAIEEFKKAIALNPRYADAYHNLANIYVGKKQIDEAIKNYQLAIKFNPQLWQSYQSLAIIYFQKQEFDLSEQYFKKAIAINPRNPNLYINLGIMYLKIGKKEEAKKAIKAALQIDPQNQKARQILLDIL
jgi:tetratricopeptide (TPR) repeat protein